MVLSTIYIKRNVMPKKLTTEKFIEVAREVHGNKYDYSKVVYRSSHDKVCIICPEHGEFWIQPNSHLNGRGCQKCGNLNKGANKKITQEEFLKRAKEIHGDKYDYSKVVYTGSKNEVCIICPEHGEFLQKPIYHTFNKCGCPKCALKANSDRNKQNRQSLEDFVKKAKEIHGDKYDYSKAEYVNRKTKICIICPVHGEFWQTPSDHIFQKQGCPKCGIKRRADKNRLSKEDFVLKAKEIHGNKYDYSKAEYVDCMKKVCIICHEKDKNGKEHGEFWQTPNSHLRGNGCPKCKESKGEREVREILENNSINYVQEKTFNWLKYNGNMFLDFYLPEHNSAIEFQGIHHFIPVDFSGGGKEFAKSNLKTQKERDKEKKRLCEEHGIKIYYIAYNEKIEKKLKTIIENVTTRKTNY